MSRIPPDVRTEYLGQFTAEHAHEIGERFDAEGVVWWTKEPGFLSQIWERGVHVFVDRAKLDRARGIVTEVLADG